ncbi:MAG: hypothetical protein K0S57_1952 [Ramlibacter sp.]|nr:hypothetical protein [Ramlibacter sp.]
MDRGDLGMFGAGLPDGELAQALAAQGVLAQLGAVSWSPIDVNDAIGRMLQAGADGVCEVASWWLPPDKKIPYDPAAELAEAWRGFVAQHPQPRLEVQGGDAGAAAESASWLARICRHPDVSAGSVFLRVDQPAWAVAWEWPLRMGVLGAAAASARGKRLQAALDRTGYRHLWSVVDMARPGAECDLLLLPGDLRQALAEVLAAPQRPRADCVLVLGGTQVSEARGLTLAAALRRETRTAGVGVLAAGGDVAEFLTDLVAELSHDLTLDVALFRAAARQKGQGGTGWPAPELLFSRALATGSSARRSAARIARELAPGAGADPAVGAITRALQDRVDKGHWESEMADASDAAVMRADIERVTGQRHRVARMAANGPAPKRAMPPQPTDQPDDREVLAQVVEQGSGAITQALQPDRAYELRVKIAPPQAGFTAPGQAFPSHELPPSESGPALVLSFVPLAAGAGGERPAAPQQRQVYLPAQGESTPAAFTFQTHGLAGPFRARLLVSHENRVIQTLRLDGQADGAYSFTVENLVQPGFHNLPYQAAFDAALVVNHSTSGQAGITLLADSSVSFLEPAGMGDMLEMLKATLTDETALRRAETSLDSAAMTDLVYALTQHGRLLYDFVEAQLGALDASAGRIQVVEARPGAYFPAEFLYPLEVPPAKPPLCPHAATSLAGGSSHQDCPHRDDPDHLCPLRFWGFRKQIERQPAGATPPGTQPAALTVPTPLNARLDLFRSVQVARSDKVQPADYDLPEGLLKVLNASFASVGTPGSWKQWKGAIAEQSPGFLLLLSHSTEDATSHLPALEISKDVLPVASVEASYVKGPQAAAPVVFLMGCSTADPKVGFLNFVERFKRKQAALVVGTLSTISAQRAARFLALALPLFKAATGSGRTFGEVFLEVKRAALAQGDGFALSLVAYGDTGWQL